MYIGKGLCTFVKGYVHLYRVVDVDVERVIGTPEEYCNLPEKHPRRSVLKSKYFYLPPLSELPTSCTFALQHGKPRIPTKANVIITFMAPADF